MRNHHLYRLIFEGYYRVKIPKGYHIHHIDGNCNNNDPLNLECLSVEEHALRHPHMKRFISVTKSASIKGGRVQGARNKENGHWKRIQALGNSAGSIIKRNSRNKLLKRGFCSDNAKRKSSLTGKQLRLEGRGIFSVESRTKVKHLLDTGMCGWKSLSYEQRCQMQALAQVKREANPKYKEHQELLKACGKEARISYWLVWHTETLKPFIIRNMTKFCHERGLSPGTMGMVSRNVREHHKGWCCRKIDKDDENLFLNHYEVI